MLEYRPLSSLEGTLAIGSCGIFTIALAIGFNKIRKLVFKDGDNFDLAFDAGGKVSIGLTASTIVSQWTWAATLLQSSAMASKLGISGAFWYASGATVQILLFSCLAVKLKVRAPGAKTFLQVIRCRFGNRAHKVYCFYALLTNLIVMSMLVQGSTEVMVTLVEDLETSSTTLVIAIIIGSYTMLGGLGATFYAAYFNTVFIFFGIIYFAFQLFLSFPADKNNPIGSIGKVYALVKDYESNTNSSDSTTDTSSLLSMDSLNGLSFGVINLIGNFGTVFVDQAYWQSSVAAKPKDGVIGFIAGGLVWFAVPFGFATTMGMGYLALSSSLGRDLLTEDGINAGLVPVVVSGRLGGGSNFILLWMILMAVVSTGSAEVVAVASILVYDVYMVYIKKFRATLDSNTCVLCGKARGRLAQNPRDHCSCISIRGCKKCEEDTAARSVVLKSMEPGFTCKTHGRYREYMNGLGSKKTWALLWSSAAIIPLTYFIKWIQISLGWLYLFMGVLIGSAVVPLGMALYWNRLSSKAMTFSSLGGSFIAILAWLISTYFSFEPYGFQDFLHRSGSMMPMLVGNLTSIISGAFLVVILSKFLPNPQITLAPGNPNMEEEIWAQTLDIDNPLYPWAEMYAKSFNGEFQNMYESRPPPGSLFVVHDKIRSVLEKQESGELKLKNTSRLDNRPSLSSLEHAFRKPKQLAFGVSIFLTIVLFILWPALTVPLGNLGELGFHVWVIIALVWVACATIFITITPLYWEGVALKKARNHKTHPEGFIEQDIL